MFGIISFTWWQSIASSPETIYCHVYRQDSFASVLYNLELDVKLPEDHENHRHLYSQKTPKDHLDNIHWEDT